MKLRIMYVVVRSQESFAWSACAVMSENVSQGSRALQWLGTRSTVSRPVDVSKPPCRRLSVKFKVSHVHMTVR